MSDITKILITGGCGFIGTNLIRFILDNTNWDITILDNLTTGSPGHINEFDKSRIKLLIGDIRKKTDVQKAIRNCTYVVNLAAQCGVPNSLENPMLDMEINISGLLNLLNYSVESNIENFVQASSSAVLGDQDIPVDEKKLPSPLSPYGASKLAGEAYCSAFTGSYRLPTCALRFSNVYGSWCQNKESVIPRFIRRILNNKPLIVYGNGEQTRDFIFVEDICNGIYLTLNCNLKNKFNIFQLGTGKETSINHLIEYLENIFRRKIEIKKFPKRKGEIIRNYACIAKAEDLLNFSPKIDIQEGLFSTYKWIKTFE